MNDIARHCIVGTLPAMSADTVSKVRELEAVALQMPQVDIHTEHTMHAGVYARTILVPAGVSITGAEIKIPTILILAGDALLYGDDGQVRVTGYHVMHGKEGRKQAIVALADTYLTMIFATSARTVEDVETEFTDEHAMLGSRKEGGSTCLDIRPQRWP